MAREFDMFIQENRAQASARADYAELVAFINSLAEGLDKGRSPAIREAQERLIITFRQVAEAYYTRAEQLIQADQAITPLERSEKFYRVLENLREHTLLLADVTRFHSLKVFPTERRNFLLKAIKFIARRLSVGGDKPMLLPLFTSSFRYFHFRYMDGLGLIGIPPELARNESRNKHLSVLWHEVAGHAMAIARETYDAQFEALATELANILRDAGYWDRYRQLYRQSVLQNLPKRKELEAINVLQAFQQLYEQHIVTDQIIDRNLEWQKIWLIEFLEDLFWILVLAGNRADEEAALQAMANALILRYPDPRIGDPKHPPLQLRLLVCIAYLSQGNMERIAEMIQPFHYGKEDAFNLDDPEFHRLAIAIAEFCRQRIISVDEPLLYESTISAAEKELARLVLDPGSTQKMMENIVKDVNLTEFSYQPNLERLQQEIDKAKTIDELLKIKFIYIDLYGGPPGGDPGFPPPPP